jgi:hypothetical protein
MTVLAIIGAWISFPRISIPQRAAFLIPLVTYPLIYYIVAYMPRYRIPINWILYILMGAAFWSWISILYDLLFQHLPRNPQTGKHP